MPKTTRHARLLAGKGNRALLDLPNLSGLKMDYLGAGYVTSLVVNGYYLYAGLDTSPGKVVNIDLRDFTKGHSLMLDTGEDAIGALAVCGRGHHRYVYAGLLSEPGKVVRISLGNLTRLFSTWMDASEEAVGALAVYGNHLYAGLDTSFDATRSARVVEIYTAEGIVPSKMGGVPTLATLKLGIGADVFALAVSGRYLYAALWSDEVVKIDRAKFTKVDTMTMPLDSWANALAVSGRYLYAGLGTSPGNVLKIDLINFHRVKDKFSTTKKVEHFFVRLDAGEDYVSALAVHAGYLYAGLYTSPGKVVRIDLTDFHKVDTMTLNAGEDYVNALAVHGSYLYAGLYTGPRVVKIDLIHFQRDDYLDL